MFKNKWDKGKEKEALKRFSKKSISLEHALRTYSSRLIGSEKDLVMHGGGNTSCKTVYKDIFNNEIKVMCIKGSGWDLDTIEPAGLPAVRLDPLLKLKKLKVLSDFDMVNILRSNLIDATSPTPSIETLVHAFLPATFIDHTHASPFLTLANLPNAKKIMIEIFGDKMAFVPYVMPGFELSKSVAEIFDKHEKAEGLLLEKHGHFTWGDSARSSYDKVIDQTNMVEDWLQSKRRLTTYLEKKLDKKSVNNFLLTLRGLLKNKAGDTIKMPILKLASDTNTLAFLERNDIGKNMNAGVATPDHVIRIKANPLFLSKNEIMSGKSAIEAKLNSYKKKYKKYFDSFSKNSPQKKIMLSPMPKIVWAQGVGLIGIGENLKETDIIIDLGIQNIKVIADGCDAGGFKPITPRYLFDMEYWSLEQAKIAKKASKEFSGKVVVVTGGAGKIGLATAKEFQLLGAEVVVLDSDASVLEKVNKFLGANVLSYRVDLTDNLKTKNTLAKIISELGGLDILISNAGAAYKGSMVDINEPLLRESFELNFYSHYRLAKAFYEVFEKQQSEGQLLFNISKQAVNPGKNFGAYGLPKAALMSLVRQLALELGSCGIRVNGVNADRIQSGLLNRKMIKERARARNVSEENYLAENLLMKEVKAFDVAKAFVMLARSSKTTGHVITVDGGNIAATLR